MHFCKFACYSGLLVTVQDSYLPIHAGKPCDFASQSRTLTCHDFCANSDVMFQLLDAALANPAQAQFLVAEEIARFRGRGGVSVSICCRHHTISCHCDSVTSMRNHTWKVDREENIAMDTKLVCG